MNYAIIFVPLPLRNYPCHEKTRSLYRRRRQRDSGLATFRDSDGTWGNYKIEEVCIPEALDFNRRGVIRFYNDRRREMLSAEPNPAHRAVAALERDFDVQVITQNGRRPARTRRLDAHSPPPRRTHQTALVGRSVAHRAVRRHRAGPSTTWLPTVRCCVRISSSSANRFPSSNVLRRLPPRPISLW